MITSSHMMDDVARILAQYVLIGALGARLFGFPRVTAGANITPERGAENLARLASALRDLNARVFTESVPEGLPFDVSPASLGRAEFWNLVTDAGRLGVVFARGSWLAVQEVSAPPPPRSPR